MRIEKYIKFHKEIEILIAERKEMINLYYI
jgi:hypothetical protein